MFTRFVLWKTGAPPNLAIQKSVSRPKGLNWDMWLGRAPMWINIPEKISTLRNRLFLDYSGAFFADFWCHIAMWLFGPWKA